MMSVKLKVHENKRYLMTKNGEPFYYFGDTAWELFHRLTINEADYYISVRAKQGFNVIQAVALSEFDGLTVPNRYGRLPLLNNDPTTPDLAGDYSYWDHVDKLIAVAAKYNMFVALLPTWGDKFNKGWGIGPEIFNADNAYTYGKWIGDRYKDNWNIIWMLGGDRPLTTDLHHAVVDNMAKGIIESDTGKHLITFHPCGGRSSVDDVNDRDYMDFHTVQSSHATEGYYSYKLVRRTGEAEMKPFMDAEPRYEDHPANFTADTKYLWNNDDVRQNLYWNILEGACGNTYGNHSIWSFTTKTTDYFPVTWYEAILHKGAQESYYAMKLRYSRPYFELVNDTSLVDQTDVRMAYFASAKGQDYAYIYSPLGEAFTAHLGIFKENNKGLRASWFNPRTGEEELFAIVSADDFRFVPPTSGKGQDWLLIIDVVR
jgi:hypothetical protein